MGLFSSIKKGVKKLGKFVGNAAEEIAPLAGAAAGFAIGGPMGAAAGYGLGSAASPGGFGSIQKFLVPKVPGDIPDPLVAPMIDSEAVARARRRATAAALSRGGRASTILSDSLG